ncbi:hypothetical protein TorRG33x02_111090, partial [Trema orientale]
HHRADHAVDRPNVPTRGRLGGALQIDQSVVIALLAAPQRGHQPLRGARGRRELRRRRERQLRVLRRGLDGREQERDRVDFLGHEWGQRRDAEGRVVGAVAELLETRVGVRQWLNREGQEGAGEEAAL